MENNNNNKKLLITGCGRSGTRYITFLLRRLNLDIGHETMKKDGMTSWCAAVNLSETPWGVSSHQYRFEHVFHQIRHPLKVIPSVCSFKDRSWEYICHHIYSRMDEPVILRSAKYWYYWNIEAEKIAEWQYRIENLSNVFDQFCDRLGVNIDRSVLLSTPTDINTRKHGKLIHYFDELTERLCLNFGSDLRKKMQKASPDMENELLTWDALESLDADIYYKIREKAKEYGYDN